MWSTCVIQGIQSSVSNPSVMVKSTGVRILHVLRSVIPLPIRLDPYPLPRCAPCTYTNLILRLLQKRRQYCQNGLQLCLTYKIPAIWSPIWKISDGYLQRYIGSISQWYMGSTSTGPDLCTKPRLTYQQYRHRCTSDVVSDLGCKWWHPSMGSPSSYT